MFLRQNDTNPENKLFDIGSEDLTRFFMSTTHVLNSSLLWHHLWGNKQAFQECKIFILFFTHKHYCNKEIIKYKCFTFCAKFDEV